jgi:UDP:flavonoid glycosyltransferase YjiC (YdhE family)
VPLARALIDVGHEVRFASSPDFIDTISKEGFATEPVGLTSGEQTARLIREVPELGSLPPEQLRSVVFRRLFAGIEVPARLEDLLAVLGRWHADLIVHEMTEFAAPLAAALKSVPTVNHSWGPLVSRDVMEDAGVAAGEHWEAAGLPRPDRAGMYDGLYLDVCPRSLQECHISSVPRVQALRPIPVVSAVDTEESWLRELGRRPVVTVTFGTVFNRCTDLYRAITVGLADLDLDVILALGPGVDANAIGPLPGNVQAFPWVPWAPLLAKTTVVISHGGASSTLGPLARGIPIIVVPLGADHFVNSERVLAAGAGLVLHRDAVEPLTVRRSVQEALSSQLRENAMRVAKEIAQMPAPAEVVPRIEIHARS